MLNNSRWAILKNRDNIDYKLDKKYNRKLKMYLNSYDYEKMFFEIDEHLIKIRDLKEEYIEFNQTTEGNLDVIELQLTKLIDKHSKCNYKLFNEFAKVLANHKQEIVNSFIYITDNDGKERRISNGPMEGYNRIPKDFKRNSRGFTNFEYVRSRLIWANRKNEPMLLIPKSKEEVYKHNPKKKKKHKN